MTKTEPEFMKVTYFTCALVLVALQTHPLTVNADEPENEPSELSPDYETVIVANRQPEDPFETNRSSNVVTEKELSEQAPRTTPEALQSEPGVFVQQTNHGGGAPIIRGMIGPQNLILIDGVRLNNSVYRTGPTQYLNLLDPLSLERIEVLRGPGSVLYGSDAMGGVIQGITLTPEPTGPYEKKKGAGILGRYASANHGRTLHGYLTGSACGTGAFAGFTHRLFDDLEGGRDVGVQPYSGYSSWSALGHVGHAFRSGPLEGVSVKAVYISSRINRAGRTDKLWESNKLQVYDNADDVAYARVAAKLTPIKTGMELTFSYQHFDEIKDSINMADDLLTALNTTRDNTTVHTMGTDLKLLTHVADGRVNVQYGGMFYRDFVNASSMYRESSDPFEDLSSSVYPNDSTYDNYGAYLMIDSSILSTQSGHTLKLNGGYRFHGMAGKAPATEDLAAVTMDFKGNVFSAGIQYLLHDVANIALTISQGFRAPNLAEAVMLGDNGKYFHIPNRDLTPESSNTFELLTRFKAGIVHFGATGYISGIDDFITREETTWEGQSEIDDKPVVHNVNSKDGLVYGLEGLVNVDLGHGLSTGGHLTYTRGDHTLTGGETIPMTRIPPLFGRVELRYDKIVNEDNSWFITTDVLVAWKQDRLSPEDISDVRIPDGGTPGWMSWNIGLGSTLSSHVDLVLRLENLLDEKYKYHGSGLYAPGTNVILTAKAYF